MLTKLKRLYADQRELGLGPKDAAIQAGYSAKNAKQRGYRLDRDPDVIRYRENISARAAQPEAPEPSIPPGVSDIDAAKQVLRTQLYSDDERIAQNAAKIILDNEHKAKTTVGGKKAQKGEAAKVASAGKFGAAQPPKLKLAK